VWRRTSRAFFLSLFMVVNCFMRENTISAQRVSGAWCTSRSHGCSASPPPNPSQPQPVHNMSFTEKCHTRLANVQYAYWVLVRYHAMQVCPVLHSSSGCVSRSQEYSATSTVLKVQYQEYSASSRCLKARSSTHAALARPWGGGWRRCRAAA